MRDRKEDIPLLINHFIRSFNTKKGYKIQMVSREAMDVLIRYPWPGNVRELENICQRLCILKGEGVIGIDDLPQKLHQSQSPHLSSEQSWLSEIPNEGIALEEMVQNFENHLIMRALEKTNWNKNKAAQLLHMNRTTLVEKIKKRGLAPN